MFPTDVKTWALYILLTVMLGAIGSGFWEKVFKPFFTMSTRLLLQASTFGIVAAIDGIYKEIARRSPNKPVLFILFLLSIGSAALLGGTVNDFSRTHLSEEVATKEQQGKDMADDALRKMSKEQVVAALPALRAKMRDTERDLANFRFFGAFWFFIVCGYSYARFSYISSAISYFDQCLAICSPHFSPEEKTKLLANYAVISSRQDYLRLIQSFEEIAKTNNFALPGFITL